MTDTTPRKSIRKEMTTRENKDELSWQYYLDYELGRKDYLDKLLQQLFQIQEMQEYDKDNTPLDLFDDPCHEDGFSQ